MFLTVSESGSFAVQTFAEGIEENSNDVPTDDVGIPPDSYDYAYPDMMKATNITIGLDFFKDINQSAETTQNEITEIIDNLESYGLNTIIINTSYNGVVYYEIGAKIYKSGSPLDMLIDVARQHNFFVYISFDLSDAIASKGIEELREKIDYLSLCAHKQIGRAHV